MKRLKQEELSEMTIIGQQQCPARDVISDFEPRVAYEPLRATCNSKILRPVYICDKSLHQTGRLPKGYVPCDSPMVGSYSTN